MVVCSEFSVVENGFIRCKLFNLTLKMFPQRHGRSWDTHEEIFVLNQISYGKSPPQIAKMLNRSQGAIYARLGKIACSLVRSGKTIEQASDCTTVPISELRRMLDMETELDVLKDIRNLLREIVVKL